MTTTFYNFLLEAHSVLRWIILLLLFITIFRSLNSKNPFTSADKTFGLILSISADITLLIGLYQWFVGPRGISLIQNLGMKEVMKDPYNRFFAIEHFIGMLIAIILIHIGGSYAKKAIPDSTKHKRRLIFYGLALLIMLISIPWPFRQVGAGRGWL